MILYWSGSEWTHVQTGTPSFQKETEMQTIYWEVTMIKGSAYVGLNILYILDLRKNHGNCLKYKIVIFWMTCSIYYTWLSCDFIHFITWNHHYKIFVKKKSKLAHLVNLLFFLLRLKVCCTIHQTTLWNAN